MIARDLKPGTVFRYATCRYEVVRHTFSGTTVRDSSPRHVVIHSIDGDREFDATRGRFTLIASDTPVHEVLS